MKTELTDINETQKTLTVEIPTDVVDAEIDRVAKGYAKQARLAGFRPGKAPAGIVKQRFREQILQDVARGLVSKAVDQALQERGIEPLDTPSISNVSLDEGRPLTFTADIETVPPFDPGDLSTIALRRTKVNIEDAAVDRALERLRERAAKYESAEGRAIADGDNVVLHIDRRGPGEETDHRDDVTVQLGAAGNPPGFDQNLVGLALGDEKTFSVHFPEDYQAEGFRNADVAYSVRVKEIRTRVLPPLDDEFAKDLGEFESLDQLRDRVRGDMQRDAEGEAQRQLRNDLLTQLSRRVTFDPPPSLVDREMDRRIEDLARYLAQQRIDPKQAGIDWGQFREGQRESARDTVASALVLDEIANREAVTVTLADVDKEIERFAERAGRTPAALRAQLEKDGGLARLHAGVRREKAVDVALARATIVAD